MSNLNNSETRNMIAAACREKIPFTFMDTPIENLQFMDLDTFEMVELKDIEPHMNIQITDGYDTCELYDVVDVAVYDNDYLKIETEDMVLTNASIMREIAEQELNQKLDEAQDLGEHDDLRKLGIYIKEEKQPKFKEKESEWNRDGTDKMGFYFGEEHDGPSLG